MNIIYIGAFPPGWGGVTIKNRDLYDALVKEGMSIKKIDLHRITRQRKIGEVIKLVAAVLGRNNKFVIGISTGMRKQFTHFLYLINRKAMQKSILIVMGGTAANDLVKNSRFMHWAQEYKKIFVETESMISLLKKNGMTNIALYPNCRHCPLVPYRSEYKDHPLRCVFFSYIQPQKGVDLILDVAKKMPRISFSFYGNIDPIYADEFHKQIKDLSNCLYQGIFRGNNEEVYEELKKYDVLLFPTKWDTEGVPGILVEAKVAGLPCIVSDKSYNRELVENGSEGIVLSQNDVDHLYRSIQAIDQDRCLLQKLSDGSSKSAKKFFIENYIEDIVNEIS